MVAVVTDSASNVPAGLAHDLGITIVPLWVRLGDDEFRDGVDMPPGRFYERLGSDGERALKGNSRRPVFAHGPTLTVRATCRKKFVGDQIQHKGAKDHEGHEKSSQEDRGDQETDFDWFRRGQKEWPL